MAFRSRVAAAFEQIKDNFKVERPKYEQLIDYVVIFAVSAIFRP